MKSGEILDHLYPVLCLTEHHLYPSTMPNRASFKKASNKT
jgi:hypothetical protein